MRNKESEETRGRNSDGTGSFCCSLVEISPRRFVQFGEPQGLNVVLVPNKIMSSNIAPLRSQAVLWQVPFQTGWTKDVCGILSQGD